MALRLYILHSVRAPVNNRAKRSYKCLYIYYQAQEVQRLNKQLCARIGALRYHLIKTD